MTKAHKELPRIASTHPSKNGKVQHGPRITGLQCFFSEVDKNLRLIVTTNDSRIQIFDLNEKRPLEVLKGFQSGSSRHRAQLLMMKNEPVVFTGSDDHWFYAWKMQSYNLSAEMNSIVPSKKKRLSGNMSFKGLLRIVSNKSTNDEASSEVSSQSGSRMIQNSKNAPQTQYVGSQAVKNNHYISFHAHSAPVTCASIAPDVALKNVSLSNDLIFELTSQYFKELNQNNAENNGANDSKATLQATKESGGFSTNLSNVVNNVGTILITTDNQGSIRVFRTDILPEIRKKIIEKFDAYNSFHSEATDKRSQNNDSIFVNKMDEAEPEEVDDFSTTPSSNADNKRDQESRLSSDFYEQHFNNSQVVSGKAVKSQRYFQKLDIQ